MSKILELYNQNIIPQFKSTPGLERKIQGELGKLVTQMYQHALSSSAGYCYKFVLPILNVMTFFKLLNLTPTQVEQAYRSDWKYPSAKTRMYADPFYHVLLLLVFHGLKTKQDVFVNHAMLLILSKLWNGRKSDFIKRSICW